MESTKKNISSSQPKKQLKVSNSPTPAGRKKSRIVEISKPIIEETENSGDISSDEIIVDYSASIVDAISQALGGQSLTTPTQAETTSTTSAQSFAQKEQAKEILYKRMLSMAQKGVKDAFIEIRDELIKIEESKANFEFADEEGNTALHLCAKEGNKKIADLLVQLEVDVNKTNKAGQTPIHFSVEGYFGNIVGLLT